MRRAFVIEHWGLTILLAPLTSQAIGYIRGNNLHQVVGLLEVYPVTLIFSVLFSLPTLLVYIACFYFLSQYDVMWVISKLILIGVCILGIYVTMASIKGIMSGEIVISYSITTLIVGILLKLKPKNTAMLEMT